MFIRAFPIREKESAKPYPQQHKTIREKESAKPYPQPQDHFDHQRET
jgi:hypothetical protein